MTQEITLNLVLTLQQNITINEWDGRFRSGRKKETPDEPKCVYPEYVVFSWVLCLIALAAALKLYYLIKTSLAVLLVGTFIFLVLVVFDDVFATTNLNDYQ